jgi:hypothetical protein
MLLANAPYSTARLTTDGGFSYTYAGWNIITPPPEITGKENYPPSPSPLVQLQTANGAWIQSQTVTPNNTQTQNLKVTGGTTTGHNFWATGINNGTYPVNLALATPVVPGLTYQCDVTLTLNMAACVGRFPSHYYVVVNGQQIGSYSPTNENWHNEQISIPAGVLHNGANQIHISSQDNSSGIWIQSITANSAAINISASSQWQQICAGYLSSGNSFQDTQTVSQGNTTTDSSTMTYGQEFGFSVSIGGIEELLFGLGGQLSASFSFQESTEHSVSITKESSNSWGPAIGPAPSGGLTFQAWQLCIVYEANGKQIVEALGINGPIIVCQYPDS